MSIDSIVNQALDLAGHKRHIGSIWDGSPDARIALNAYAETRDEVLAAARWDFARAFPLLVPSTQPVPLWWTSAYLRPADAIVVLDVFPSNPVLLEPEPSRWVETFTTERVILTNFTGAKAAITSRVLDPVQWTPEFTMAVIRGLAQKLHSLGAPVKEPADESRGRDQQRA